MYKLTLSPRAEKDLKNLLKSEPQAYKKALSLLQELLIHPKVGTGKPILKKHNLSGLYARKITDKHRLIYSINDEVLTVFVLSAKGHYDDK